MQDDILAIALELSESTRRKIADLDQIMMKTKILTMNARLEAARARSEEHTSELQSH